jgi:hypothetical protein
MNIFLAICQSCRVRSEQKEEVVGLLLLWPVAHKAEGSSGHRIMMQHNCSSTLAIRPNNRNLLLVTCWQTNAKRAQSMFEGVPWFTMAKE